MQVRSWMAAGVLIAGSTVLLSGVARSQKAGPDQPPPGAEPKAPGVPRTEDRPNSGVQASKAAVDKQTVELNVFVAGLGQNGCEVDIKPGTRSTRFQPQHQRIESQGKAKFVFRDVEVLGADRNCTFAITVREPDQAARTILRGFRLVSKPTATPTAAGAPATRDVQKFTCYMNSPSKLAGLEQSGQTRR